MEKENKVLVTGANGLLGSHVVRELLMRNYKVRVFVREGSDLRALKNLTIEYFTGQIISEKDVYNAVKGCDFVVHAAARTSQVPSALKAFEKPNIESTKNIIKACKELKIKRLVYVSTANCFGNGTLKNPGNEETPFMPWLKSSGYAYSKYLAQQMVLEEVNKNGLDAVVVNPTFIIGKNDFKPSSGQIFNHVVKKSIVFYPTGGKNFVDAEMAAKGVVNAMENGRLGACYLLAGENHSYLRFFRLVTRVLKQKTVFVPIPRWLLLAAGYCGSCYEKIRKKPIQLTYTNARMLCLNNFFTADKACRELDFKVVPVSESVEKAILWFQKNNYFN
uniref:NAD-dependent epimerase/dehydratase family protein n=1 Tax=uncultured Draconibacterium sp. TaxID=1573823 RepID=UPI0032170326